MLHSHDLQVLCWVLSGNRDRGLWENWLITKTVSPPRACGGELSGHVASGRGGRVKTSQTESL